MRIEAELQFTVVRHAVAIGIFVWRAFVFRVAADLGYIRDDSLFNQVGDSIHHVTRITGMAQVFDQILAGLGRDLAGADGLDDALIDGVAMDAAPRRFETFADLEPYCHRVASSVGLICAEIFEYREKGVLDYARDLGVALQLTNILRDVAVDYRVGRFYLPAADLAKFGVAEGDIRQEVEHAGHGVRSENVRAALAHHADRAREYFDRATRALPREDASRFVAAEIMRAIYWELLCRIEAARWDVFTTLIRIPRPAQARLALKTWWRLRR